MSYVDIAPDKPWQDQPCWMCHQRSDASYVIEQVFPTPDGVTVSCWAEGDTIRMCFGCAKKCPNVARKRVLSKFEELVAAILAR